ncbi:hypothetical protein D3C87_1577850 [compost metagenome]
MSSPFEMGGDLAEHLAVVVVTAFVLLDRRRIPDRLDEIAEDKDVAVVRLGEVAHDDARLFEAGECVGEKRKGGGETLPTLADRDRFFPDHRSSSAFRAFFSMNSRRSGTSLPMRVTIRSLAAASSSMVTCVSVRAAGSSVVSCSWSAFISPRPL